MHGKPGEPFSDYIESAAADKIVVVGESDDFRDVATLDLISESVLQIRHFYRDRSTGTWSEKK
jgi:hypothetical protein